MGTLRVRRRFGAALACAATTLLLLASSAVAQGATRSAPPRIEVVGAESQYASVLASIGAPYVNAIAIEDSPSADPHSFEASATVVRELADAALVVQNGLGYDAFMETIEAATPSRTRTVIGVATLVGRSSTTVNPHLWYDPTVMPKVAAATASALCGIERAHCGRFRANLARFDASMRRWLTEIASLRAAARGRTVAVTEPVGDYLLAAAGIADRTPMDLQLEVMNGIDLPPQYVELLDSLLQRRRVDAFAFNAQVLDATSAHFLADARQGAVPVVALYETMPAGYDYLSWMLAETRALDEALVGGHSTARL